MRADPIRFLIELTDLSKECGVILDTDWNHPTWLEVIEPKKDNTKYHYDDEYGLQWYNADDADDGDL